MEAHGYDAIGNSTIAAFNGVTNVCTANGLNQYASIVCASASPCGTAVEYDLDGNMTQCGDWTFTYDAANRLKTVSSNGVLLVTNFYDAKGRRVRKVTAESATTFFYDGWNLIEERISCTNGVSSTIHYYWGKDISGKLQGAGGVGGLLYLTVDGAVYVPFYDNNGNVTRYLDANGNTVAQYTYDTFGNTILQSGPLSDVFRIRFSTKYFDAATGLYYYGHRFYSPVLRRWLTRDPIEEDGGLNLYCFVENSPSWLVDFGGLHTFQFNDKGWLYGDTLSGALTDNVSVLGATRTSLTSASKCRCNYGKWTPDYTFKVDVYSLIQFADDRTWDDKSYGNGIRDSRVREQWDSFWFFAARRRRNLVVEHEERHRKHAQKNYAAIIRELSTNEQYGSKGLCESKASEKLATAVRLFELMEQSDGEKVERGGL